MNKSLIRHNQIRPFCSCTAIMLTGSRSERSILLSYRYSPIQWLSMIYVKRVF